MRFVFAACLADAAAAGGDLSSREQKTPWWTGIRLDCRVWNEPGWRRVPPNPCYFHLPDMVRPGTVHGIGKCRLSSVSCRVRGSCAGSFDRGWRAAGTPCGQQAQQLFHRFAATGAGDDVGWFCGRGGQRADDGRGHPSGLRNDSTSWTTGVPLTVLARKFTSHLPATRRPVISSPPSGHPSPRSSMDRTRVS